MSNTENMNVDEILDKVGVPKDQIESITRDVDGTPIVNLNESGKEEFDKQMNDLSLNYLRKFVDITKENKDKVDDKFYNIITRLNDIITKYNAPWYVGFYQAVKNPIVLIVYYNTHKDEYDKDYNCIIEKLVDIIVEIMDKFELSISENENSEENKTFPVTYAIKNIQTRVQEECNCEAKLVEKFDEYLNKLKEKAEKEKQEAQENAIKYSVLFSELLKKSKKDKGYKHLVNKLLISANPAKYSLKQPKTLKLEEMMNICERLYNIHGNIENLIIKYKIPEEIVKVFELTPEELEQIHDKNIREKLMNESETLRNLAKQMEQVSDGKITAQDIIDGKEPTEEDLKKLTDTMQEAVDSGELDYTEDDTKAVEDAIDNINVDSSDTTTSNES